MYVVLAGKLKYYAVAVFPVAGFVRVTPYKWYQRLRFPESIILIALHGLVRCIARLLYTRPSPDDMNKARIVVLIDVSHLQQVLRRRLHKMDGSWNLV